MTKLLTLRRSAPAGRLVTEHPLFLGQIDKSLPPYGCRDRRRDLGADPFFMAATAAVSTALLRKMSVDWSYRKPQGPAESKEQVRARILNCPFEVELDVSAIRVPAEQLVDLYPGKLLVFNHSVDSPATLVVGDQPLYQAFVMRHNRKRVARLNRAIPRPTGGKERS